MSTTVSYNGSSYQVPANRESRGWGTSLSNLIIDMAQSSLSKSGGTFTLTAEANFGTSYGLVVKYIKSTGSDLASVGVVRLANAEVIAWRNDANSANLALTASASDRLTFGGEDVPTISSTDTLTNKTLISPAITTPTGIVKGDVGLGNVDNTSDVNKPISTLTQTALDLKANLASPPLASPTFTDYTLFTEVSAPSTPASGKVAVYAKTDKKMYRKGSDGVETEIGSGAGSGAINYISNADLETGATTGWATYKDAAAATPVDGTGGSPTTLTLSANSSSPMRGSYDFKVVKSAANSQGEGFSYDFTIKTPDKSKKLNLSFDLNSNDANFAAGDVVIYVYDVTNSTLITPSSTSLPKVGASTYNITFDSTTSTSYRLIFHWAVTTATAVSLYFDNFILGPGTITQGAAISEWVASSFTSSVTTNATTTSYYQRVGSTLKGRVYQAFSGASNAGTGPDITMPAGLTINTTVYPSGTVVGTARFADDSTGLSYNGILIVTSTTTMRVRYMDDTANGVNDVNTTATTPYTIAANDYWVFAFDVPISEWAGNGTVNLGAGAQVEYVSHDGSNNVYGSGGSLVPNQAFATGTTSRTVTFQYPVQASDAVWVEFNYRGQGWQKAADIVPGLYGYNGSVNNVYGIQGLALTPTTYICYFGNQGSQPTNTTTSNGQTSWATEYAANTKWRVCKAKASSPVGFGLADTTASGLLPAGVYNNSTGAWTLGVANGSATHAINGNRVSLVSSSTADYTYFSMHAGATQNGYIGVLGSTANTLITSTAANYLAIVGRLGIAFSASDGASNQGSLSSAGAWTLGPDSGCTTQHVIRNDTAAGSSIVGIHKYAVASNQNNTYYIDFAGVSGGPEGYIQTNGSGVLTLVDSSDARKKTNIRPATYGLSTINQLNPVEYDWIAGCANVKGFIAQEVISVIPECVSIKNEQESGGLADTHYLEMQTMIPVLVKAVQELSAKNDALEARLAALESV